MGNAKQKNFQHGKEIKELETYSIEPTYVLKNYSKHTKNMKVKLLIFECQQTSNNNIFGYIFLYTINKDNNNKI